MRMKVHLLKLKKKGVCCSNTYLFSRTHEFQKKNCHHRNIEMVRFCLQLHRFCMELFADSVETEKTEETHQQHKISKINMQNELLLGLGNMQVFIALAQYL